MKTRLFIGQPLGVPACLSFENVADLQKWLDERTKGASNMARCISTELGADGTRDCYPPNGPHRHKMRLAASSSVDGHAIETTCCDNHLGVFLHKGYTVVRKLCNYCTSNEAAKGEDICENCLDLATRPPNEAERLKRVGYCINREQVHGCLGYSEVDSHYCTFCKVQNIIAPADQKAEAPKAPEKPAALKPRIRLIGSSTRPCRLTPGCAGNMNASVYFVNADRKPELWWQCLVCRVRQVAQKTQAVLKKSGIPPMAMEPLEAAALLESIQEDILDTDTEPEATSEAPKAPVSAEKADMTEQIRNSLGSNLGG